MKMMRNAIQLIFLLLTAVNLKAQILIPEDLPSSGELVYLGQSDSKLWAIQQLPGNTAVKTFSISLKNGNRWDRLPNLQLVAQNNSKGIRITDIEVYLGRVFISGDFAVPGKSRNCLVSFETSGSVWAADFEFTGFQGPPVVNTIAELNNTLFLGGVFQKVNNTECINLLKFEKTGLPQAIKLNQQNGSAGVVTCMEPDSTKTMLYIGGLFRNILGKNINGLITFNPKDSAVEKVSGDIAAVFKMYVAGGKLLMHAAADSIHNSQIFIYENSVVQVKSIDSLSDVNSLFAHKGRHFFTGTALVNGKNRESGLFEFTDPSKAMRAYVKFGKIRLAESFGGFIHINGSVFNIFTQATEGYELARIDDNYQRFYGRVFFDANNNGIYNQGIDLRVGNRDARIQPLDILVPVERSGYFSFIIPKGKSIVIQVSIPKTQELVTGATYKFNADTFTERMVDFPLKFAKSNFTDVGVNVTSATGWKCRKDTSELYVIKLSNRGLVAVKPDLKLHFNGKMVLIKPVPAPDIIDPGKLTWSAQTLLPGDEKTYLIKLTTPGTDFSDQDLVSFSASVSGITDDNPVDNSDTLTQTVSSGVETNAKYQYPEAGAGDTVAWIHSNEGKIDYIIRFTNTTNDTISTLVVRDTISTPDYVTYIQETGSSHPFTRYVYTNPNLPEKVIVSYTFTGLKLPPNPTGNTELVNSSGYVGFRLGLTPNLSSGTDLRNRASIFMENYSPILTNTVRAMVVSTSVNDLKSNGLTVYPNPVVNELYFSEELEQATFQLLDAQGKVIINREISGKSIEIGENVAAGTYFWNVYSKHGSMNRGIVIKI